MASALLATPWKLSDSGSRSGAAFRGAPPLLGRGPGGSAAAIQAMLCKVKIRAAWRLGLMNGSLLFAPSRTPLHECWIQVADPQARRPGGLSKT